jgi:hypothetical protein
MSNLDLKDPKVKAELIWATMSSHAILDRIIQARFKSDPVVTTAMSNFIMKNRVDKSAFTDLSSKVTQVVRKADSLETESKSAKTTLQEHGRELTRLQKTKADKKS